MPVDLAGQKVLVTAGGSGIGLVIAEAFLARGAQVWICDIDEAALQKARETLPGVHASLADVADPAQVAALFVEIRQAFGGLDVLVNNAGIAGPTANVEDVSPEALAETLGINVGSQFFCASEAVPLMKAAGRGAIVNLSSIAGRLGFSMRSPYSASKWAVVGFTKSLAMELGAHDIRVNAILPGHVRTERFNRVAAAKAVALGITAEEMRRQMLDPVSLKRNVEVEDIANMALYLASPFGRNITGQAISVCGDVQMMR
ncbi:MAG: SDR family oxidoreductase [Hyphomicrobiaceae bacterium]|nr:SDR family oxidoreductase [Hyphomicrobiaceae bacterium]